MAKNEKSSKKLATIAADILSGGWDQRDYPELLKVTYALAGSVLTQAPDKPKKKAATKGKKK